MNETIHYTPTTKVIVFDEPIPEYRDLMLTAASDKSHALHKNYTKDVLRTSLFMTLWCVDDEPAEMWALTQEPWMVEYGLARGFDRTYKAPKFRAPINTKENDKYAKALDAPMLVNFYNDNPKFHTERNINTIMFTRHYTNDRYKSLARLIKHYKAPYKEAPDIYLYRHVPQRVYYWGASDFLTHLTIHDSNKQSAEVPESKNR